jgi:hypothetical protein
MEPIRDIAPLRNIESTTAAKRLGPEGGACNSSLLLRNPFKLFGDLPSRTFRLDIKTGK